MLGKGVKLGDVLLAIAIVLPVGLLTGAALGYFGDRFGLSGGLRVLVIVAFTGLAGRLAAAFVARRVKARSVSTRMQV